MESLFVILIIGAIAYHYFKKVSIAKEAERKRIAQAAARKRRDKINKSPIASQPSLEIAPASKVVRRPPTKLTNENVPSSSSRRPTYAGARFAQAGQKGDLFGYASFTANHEISAPYSLIDFETSGFTPSNGRILEIGIVKLDRDGRILDEYSTLVNPGDNQLGRTDIHQITSRMIRKAPLIEEVLGDVLKFLDSTIIVAHNAIFEEKFLYSALMECGVIHPVMPTIDTLWLSRQALELPNYRLSTVIDAFDFSFEDAHTALGDVRAMAKILPALIDNVNPIRYPNTLSSSPLLEGKGKSLPRGTYA
jgi:DNA polymerase III epsilon subunit-like protein